MIVRDDNAQGAHRATVSVTKTGLILRASLAQLVIALDCGAPWPLSLRPVSRVSHPSISEILYASVCVCMSLPLVSTRRREHKMRKLLDELWWSVGVWTLGRCPDPKCRGHMDMYDDRPDRDFCSKCSLGRRQLDKGMRRQRPYVPPVCSDVITLEKDSN